MGAGVQPNLAHPMPRYTSSHSYQQEQPSRSIPLAPQAGSLPATDLEHACGCSNPDWHSPSPNFAFAIRCCSLAWPNPPPVPTLAGGCCGLALPSLPHHWLSCKLVGTVTYPGMAHNPHWLLSAGRYCSPACPKTLFLCVPMVVTAWTSLVCSQPLYPQANQ